MICHCTMQTLCDIYLLNSHRDRRNFGVIDERESVKIGRSAKFQNYLRKDSSPHPPKTFHKDWKITLIPGSWCFSSMGKGRCCAERPTGKPPLLKSFAAQRRCNFGLNFKFGDIWAHWQRGAGALGSLDAWTSHPPHNDGGQLDGVSTDLNASSNQERLSNLS